MPEDDKQTRGAYHNISDEMIVSLAGDGDKAAEEFLINKYKNFVRAKARPYFLIGADKEDLVQEGMIGLFKAIRDYKPDMQSYFPAFAELCVTRQIITAVKTSTRQKHIPLNSYVSLNKPAFDADSERTLLELIDGSRVIDPEELLINKEEFDAIEGRLSEALSPLERQVLVLFLDGKTYQEIADALNRHTKAVDNALQRIKRKLESFLASRGQSPEN